MSIKQYTNHPLNFPSLHFLQRSFRINPRAYASRIHECSKHAAARCIVLIGCRTDIETKREVTREEGQLLADELQCPFYEASAEANINVTEAFMTAARMGLQVLCSFDYRRGKTDRCYKDHAVQKLEFTGLVDDDCRFCSACRAIVANGSHGAECHRCQYYLCTTCSDVKVTVERDMQKFFSNVRLSAINGNASSQFDLGLCLFNGEGVGQDFAEAATWFQLAARQGLVNAQFMLGKIYSEGKGLKKSHSKALDWFLRAADQNFAAAENKLQKMQLNQLHVAAVKGDHEFLKTLLASNADIHAKDMYGVCFLLSLLTICI